MANYRPDKMRISQNMCYLEIMDRVYDALGNLPQSYFEDLIEKFRIRALDFVESSEFKSFVEIQERNVK